MIETPTNTNAVSLFTGTVKAVDNDRDGILVGEPRYTITVVWPQGGSSDVPGQRAGLRSRPANVEADPSIMVNQQVVGLWDITGWIHWVFVDPDKVEYCGGSLQSMPGFMIDPVTGLPIPVPPITPGQTTATPPEPSPPIGGDGGAA